VCVYGFFGEVESYFFSKAFQPGVVVHVCTVALGRLRQEDCEFEVSVSHSETLSQKNKNTQTFETFRKFERMNSEFSGCLPSRLVLNICHTFKVYMYNT
jgi:hypothetical protein